MKIRKIVCTCCKKKFNRELRFINLNKKRKRMNFCSQACNTNFRKLPNILCKLCNKKVIPKYRNRKFCSSSCSATYNNTHKKGGIRISKLEKFLQNNLQNIYKFPIIFNSKQAINSELDIYIPSLKIAFEINGVFHYKPIFGISRLSSIRNNDKYKFYLCKKNKIKLHIVNTMKHRYVTNLTCLPYLEKIQNIINKQLK